MVLITISGAQGSGKTSLTQQLLRDCEKHYRNPIIIPSFSHGLMQQCAPLGITCYDDINRLGLRSLFQDFILAQIVSTASRILSVNSTEHEVVIVDRWYLDAMAYSQCELTEPDYKIWLSKCIDIIQRIEKTFDQSGQSRYHFITPYLNWDVADKKASRSTFDPLRVHASIMEHRKMMPCKHIVLKQESSSARSVELLTVVQDPNQ